MPSAGLEERTVAGHDEKVYVSSVALLTNADVRGTAVSTAVIGPNEETGTVLELFLTAEGTKTFAVFTREHVRQRIAILIDGNVRSAPVIAGEIHVGRVPLIADFCDKDGAIRMAKGIVGE